MTDPERAHSLGEALHLALQRWSRKTCLVEVDRGREKLRLTYEQFRTRALPLAAFLRECDFRPGDRAAIVMTNQSKWHLSAYAVFHRGGVLVPLDFKLDAEEHLRLLAHCRPKVLVVEHHLWRAMARAEGFAALKLEHVLVSEGPEEEALPAPPGVPVHRWEECSGACAAGPPRARRGEHPACIVYSSGTGGRPKGCLLTHENYLEQFRALSRLHPLHPGVRYLSILPTNHAIDFMVGFVGPYLCGATVVHLRTLRPEFVHEAFRRYRITHVSLVPLILENLREGLERRLGALPPPRRALLRALVRVQRLLSRGRPDPRIGRILLRPVHAALGGKLEAIFVGGATTDPATLRFFHDLGIPVANGYGLTEACTAITLDRLNPPRPETVGQPLEGIEVRIHEPDAQGIGEILVRGPTVMAGYLDDPELTAEALSEGWLRTGDLGRLETDGCLKLLGRKKNMIVTRGGKNVYPEDVERAFAGTPGARELCIFATHYLWPHQAGAEEQLLIVIRPEPSPSAGGVDPRARIRREVLSRNRTLAEFQRVAEVLFWEEDFPRTASLKIRRQELARRIAKRFPEPPRILQGATGDRVRRRGPGSAPDRALLG